MADTHEEQLLSRLLGEVAHEDRALDAAYLEARVLESANAAEPARPRAAKAVYVIAAALAAVAIASWSITNAGNASDRIAARAVRGAAIASQSPPAPPTQPVASARGAQPSQPGVQRVREVPSERAASRAKLPPAVEPAEGPAGAPAFEFVPLMPLAEHELSGSFQIVRVQMPNASLGPLGSPTGRPNEVVEADVLLGEDGRARAIRLNTSGSIYPWRSR